MIDTGRLQPTEVRGIILELFRRARRSKESDGLDSFP